MPSKFNTLIGVVLLSPTLTVAKINMAEVNAYAYEGLADMCTNSRSISRDQQKEMQAIYLKIKNQHKKGLPADDDFAIMLRNSCGTSIIPLTTKSVLRC